MSFGIIGRTGPGMRQIVRFGDRSTETGTFGGEFGARHCTQWGLTFRSDVAQITLGRLVYTLTVFNLLRRSRTWPLCDDGNSG